MKNDELNRTYDQLKLRYMDTIEALRQAVDAKDIYTRDIPTGSLITRYTSGSFGMNAQELETLSQRYFSR